MEERPQTLSEALTQGAIIIRTYQRRNFRGEALRQTVAVIVNNIAITYVNNEVDMDWEEVQRLGKKQRAASRHITGQGVKCSEAATI